MWTIDSASSSSASASSSSPSCVCACEYRGHNDVVRDVKVTSCDLFLSASNDWWVHHRTHSLHNHACMHALNMMYFHIYCTCIYTYNYVYILFFILLSVIRQWNIHTGLCLKELFGHEAFIYRLREERGRGGERGEGRRRVCKI